MFKTVLVALEGGAYFEPVVETGLSMTEAFEGRVLGLHVIDLRKAEGPSIQYIGDFMEADLYYEYRPELREVMEEKGKELLKDFSARTVERKLDSEALLEYGLVSDEICKKAFLADLVVMGKRGDVAGAEGEKAKSSPGSTLIAALRRVHKPVLVVPAKCRAIRKALLAYDGSQAANAALRDGAALVKLLGLPAVLLTVGAPEEARDIVSEAESYLRPYGMDLVKITRRGDEDSLILSVAEEEGCDLIIMGAYGHSRVREIFLGSTTESVLKGTTLPVLLHR